MFFSSLFSMAMSAPVLNKLSAGSGDRSAAGEERGVPLWRSGVLLLILGLLGIALWIKPPLTLQPQAGVVMALPDTVGDYFGRPAKINQFERDALPSDTEFARKNYDDLRGHVIQCTIVLSGAQQRSLHRPEACLQGQGWDIVHQENVPIQLASGHKLIARNLWLERYALGNNNERILVKAFYLYWFVGDNVTTPSHFTRIFLSNWDRVIHGRAHRWAAVCFFSYVTDNLQSNGLNRDQTLGVMKDFATQIVPTFQKSEMLAPAGN